MSAVLLKHLSNSGWHWLTSEKSNTNHRSDCDFHNCCIILSACSHQQSMNFDPGGFWPVSVQCMKPSGQRYVKGRHQEWSREKKLLIRLVSSSSWFSGQKQKQEINISQSATNCMCECVCESKYSFTWCQLLSSTLVARLRLELVYFLIHGHRSFWYLL